MSNENVPGSRQLPYNLAIIGGGPAGSSIILRAIHLNLSNELLSGKYKRNLEYDGETAGVCIFDIGSKTRFGGGKLQDYKINSNTNGAKFVTNLTQDRPNVLPPEIATGTPLENIGKTKLGKFLLEYRATTAPLDHIGKFLVEVGDVVLNQIDQHNNSTYHCETQVIKIQQYHLNVNINTKEQNNSSFSIWRIIATNLTTKVTFETYSRYVVLATGGKQTLPKSLPNVNSSKLFSSDYVCTENGITELITKLKNFPRKRIVIIGGSHSAFSAAWICLNKLGWNSNSSSNNGNSNIINNGNSDINLHSTIGNSSNNSSSNNSIYIIHRHEIKVFYSCKRDADRDKYNTYEGINKQGQIHPFSGLRGDAKTLYRNIRTGIETRVRLLCVGSDGSNHQTLYTRLCEEAHVVIWACGYEAALNFPIVDSEDIPIPIVMTRGQVEVNDLAQVLTTSTSPIISTISLLSNTTTDSTILRSNSISSSTSNITPTSSEPIQIPIPNLLATGLGFGLNVSGDSSNLTLCKADGVAVYLKRAATLILSHILGPKVFGEGILTWEQHVIENVKRWNEQQALLRSLKNNNNDGDDDNYNDNEYAQIQSNLTSPCSPSKLLNKNRCPTPMVSSPISSSTTSTSPIITSPIRRQIRTASSNDFSSRRKREGNQIGITNNGPHPPPKKIPSSPIIDKKPRNIINKSIKNEIIQIRTESKDNIVDSGDSDPYELYLSGLVSTSVNISSEKLNQNQNQISPLISPKIIHEDTIDCDELLPPPQYSLELDPSTSIPLSSRADTKLNQSYEISSGRSEEYKDIQIIPNKLNDLNIVNVVNNINSQSITSLSNIGISNSSPVTPRKFRSSSVSVGVQHSPNDKKCNTLSPQESNNIPIAWTTTVSSTINNTQQKELNNNSNKNRKQSNPQTKQLFHQQNKEIQEKGRSSSNNNNNNNNNNNSIKKSHLGPKVQNLNLSSTIPSSKISQPSCTDKFPLIINNSHNKQQQQQQLSSSLLAHESRQTSGNHPPPSLTSLHGVKKLLVIKSAPKVS